MTPDADLKLDQDRYVEMDFAQPVRAFDCQGVFLHAKYTFDRTVGVVSLLLLWPLILILWALVKATSKGPGFYKQRRIGLHGHAFNIYKLRTMYIDAEAAGIQWASGSKDRRITPLGRWLRKLHLDELPQLFNVIRGEMCLVGPRPERPEIISSLEILIPNYHRRHQVKPGITGLAQINLEPDHNINDTRRKQVLDVRYIRAASPWMDARMIFATILRIFGIKGERVIQLSGLKQNITEGELISVGYQFDASPDELWNPQKGPVWALPDEHRSLNRAVSI